MGSAAGVAAILLPHVNLLLTHAHFVTVLAAVDGRRGAGDGGAPQVGPHHLHRRARAHADRVPSARWRVRRRIVRAAAARAPRRRRARRAPGATSEGSVHCVRSGHVGDAGGGGGAGVVGGGARARVAALRAGAGAAGGGGAATRPAQAVRLPQQVPSHSRQDERAHQGGGGGPAAEPVLRGRTRRAGRAAAARGRAARRARSARRYARARTVQRTLQRNITFVSPKQQPGQPTAQAEGDLQERPAGDRVRSAVAATCQF